MIGRKWKVSEKSAENSVTLFCEIIPSSLLHTKGAKVRQYSFFQGVEHVG